MRNNFSLTLEEGHNITHTNISKTLEESYGIGKKKHDNQRTCTLKRVRDGQSEKENKRNRVPGRKLYWQEHLNLGDIRALRNRSSDCSLFAVDLCGIQISSWSLLPCRYLEHVQSSSNKCLSNIHAPSSC